MLSIYLHIPFCRRKCAYCDFFSVPGTEGGVDLYAKQLKHQLHFYRGDPRWQGPVDTVFFGGGTPSLISPTVVADLLQAIEDQYGWSERPEITLEANPETVDPNRLEGYRESGVNRLSFGVQSLDSDQLEWLGRGHSNRQARKAVTQANEAGFDEISVDLIFGVPGQDRNFIGQELVEVAEWGITHLSCYGLTLEEGTPLQDRLSRGEIITLSEEEIAEQFLLIHRFLTRQGWDHYEISNYALPGYACRHNQAYWQRKPCLGLGAGAHSFVARGWGERWAVPASIEAFETAIERREDPMECLERFHRKGAMNESAYLALRTRQGIDVESFRSTFGVDLHLAYPTAFQHLENHLIHHSGHWAFKPESWLLYDHLVQEFL